MFSCKALKNAYNGFKILNQVYLIAFLSLLLKLISVRLLPLWNIYTNWSTDLLDKCVIYWNQPWSILFSAWNMNVQMGASAKHSEPMSAKSVPSLKIKSKWGFMTLLAWGIKKKISCLIPLFPLSTFWNCKLANSQRAQLVLGKSSRCWLLANSIQN